MTAVRHPSTGQFVKLTPALVAPVATRHQKLKVQQETMAQRIARLESVAPSRDRVRRARQSGYRGPLTRADLTKVVR
jgi:hypothetical protein